MKHSYTIGCTCSHCEREKLRREAQSKANQRRANQSSRRSRQVRSWNDWHAKGREFDIQCD